MNVWTPELVKSSLEERLDELLAKYASGMPENWRCDKRTAEQLTLSMWLGEKLNMLCKNDNDRRTQLWKFNRLSRSYDLYESAAECLNDVIKNEVEQNRKPHKRWG